MLVNISKTSKRSSISAIAIAACALALTPTWSNDVTARATRLNSLPVERPVSTVDGARPDISALRYYALRGEQGRVQSEISRLRQLYPNWQQPDNIFAEDNATEQQLWKLYSDGKTDLLKAEIVRLQALNIGYTPSPELLDKIEQRETRTGVAAAWAARDWNEVINQANANPALLAGDDIELIWFLGEAYARKERPEDSFDAFGAALKSANSRQERKATIQKAALLLSTDKALQLLHATPELTDDPNMAIEVQDAIVRGALAKSAELGEPLPATLGTHLADFLVRAKISNSHEDAVLLAWSRFGQRDWKGADKWFTHALTLKQSPKAVEGAIMSAMRLQDIPGASGLAGEWLNSTPEIGALFLSVHAPALLQPVPQAMDSRFLQVYAERTVALENGEGSEALAWYAFNIRQLDAADAWFSKAMEWEETETAVYGKALTAGRRKDRAMFDAVQSSFGPKYPTVAALKYKREVHRKKPVAVKRTSAAQSHSGRLRRRIAKLHQAKQFGECLELSRSLRQYGPLKAQDHQTRGWCLMGANRPVEAAQAFAASVRLGGRGKVSSAYGQALATLRSGKTNEALSIANQNPMTPKQRRVIDIELLTQRARAAFANRDYAASVYALDKRAKLIPETCDLTLLRAWAHYHTGRITSARAIFANLDQQLSTRNSKKGLNATKRKQALAVSNDR